MTPARVIINAVAVGVLAWSGIFVLRLCPFLEPAIVDDLCVFLDVVAHCSAHSWHASDHSWFGMVLEQIHLAIVLGAVTCSAIRDFRKLWKGE